MRKSFWRLPFPLAFALALAVALCATPLPATAFARGARQAAAKQPTRVARVPFELNGNSLFLPVRVNGSGPRWFVLDTGAGITVFNSTLIDALGLKAGRSGTVAGAGGSVQTTQITDVTLGVNGAQFKVPNVAAIPLAPIENTAGRAIDGILGAELFKRYVVEIDYEARELSLYEPADYSYAGRGESLPLTFQQNHAHVRASVALPNRPPLEGEFVIDLGSNLQLILMPAFIEQHKLRDSLRPTLTTYGRGVGGEIPLPIGRAEEIRLGNFKLKQPVTAFPASGTFGTAGKAGNIGTAILRRFRVVFDYARARVHLEPAKNFAEPFEADMSGLGLASEGPSFSVFKIIRILPGTPAEEAGLKQGDEIVSVNGRAVAGTRLADLRDRLRRPEQSFALRVKRGAETLEVRLKTRRLV